MKTIAKIAAVAAFSFTAASAHAITFDFRAGGNTGGNFNLPSPVPSTPLVIGGIGIQGNGGEYDGTSIVDIDSRRLTKNDNGLGVDCAGLGAFVCADEIDGNFTVNDDLLTLVFDQVVRFDSAFFTELDEDDDVDVFIDGVAVAALTNVNIGDLNPLGNPLSLLGLTGASISFGADDASSNNLNEDDFRLGSITVSAVPLPAALPLFATALAGIGWMSRRKRSKA